MTYFIIIADTDKSLSVIDISLCSTFPPLPEENVSRLTGGNSACDVTLALVK